LRGEQVPPVEEVMVMHEEVAEEEVVVGLVLAAAEEELVDHAEPVSMIARRVASVENFIAFVLFLLSFDSFLISLLIMQI
jgi:hypothetical protein